MNGPFRAFSVLNGPFKTSASARVAVIRHNPHATCSELLELSGRNL
jgi:hypothetical protein